MTAEDTRSHSPIWKQLAQEADRLQTKQGRKLLEDEDRFNSCSLEVGSILIDWSRERLDPQAMSRLFELAREVDIPGFLHDLVQGAELNVTEKRSVQHVNLRNQKEAPLSDESEQVFQEREKFLDFAESVRTGEYVGHDGRPITNVVHIAIGGSHLGPELVCDALATDSSPHVVFISNANVETVWSKMRQLPLSQTLFVIASKSYSTRETLVNARLAKSWFLERVPSTVDISRHFVHVTANRHVPIGDEKIFYFPESIGGRFSLWSAIGLPIALALGRKQFEELLAGAYAMDRLVLDSELDRNPAIILALLALWNVNFLGAKSHLVLPYDHRLKLLVPYLQQLEMESNGKNVRKDGEPVAVETSPAVWGGPETDAQHAWHQLLHQGTHSYSADLIASIETTGVEAERSLRRWNLANAISQSATMLSGYAATQLESFKAIPGNHGSTLLLLDRIDARTLGSLLALYEHKVASLGHLWGINSFDQWGVESGKFLADDVDRALGFGTLRNLDKTTQELVRTIRNRIRDAPS